MLENSHVWTLHLNSSITSFNSGLKSCFLLLHDKFWSLPKSSFVFNCMILETVTATSVQKPKRRAYLLKRKAITTGFFDSKTAKDDKDKSKLLLFYELVWSMSELPYLPINLNFCLLWCTVLSLKLRKTIKVSSVVICFTSGINFSFVARVVAIGRTCIWCFIFEIGSTWLINNLINNALFYCALHSKEKASDSLQ